MEVPSPRLRVVGLITILAILGAALFSTVDKRQTTYQAANNIVSVTPKKTEDFVNSIGVSAHLTNADYKQNSYFSDVFNSVIKPKVRELGVRNIRQYPSEVDSNFPINVSRFNELSNPPSGYPKISFSFETHIDPSVSSNPQNNCYLPKMKYILNGTVGNCNGLQNYTSPSSVATLAVENPNEPDHCPSWVCGTGNSSNWYAHSITQNSNWPDDVLATAQAAQTKLAGDAATQNIQRIAPAFVWLPYFQNETYNGVNLKTYLEPLKSYVTHGNVHPYCGTSSVATCWSNQVQPYVDYYAPKPVIVTETGHSTSQYTETQQAKYLLRILFDFFERGIPRTYVYELLDEPTAATATEQNFGLLNEDGREKPAFTWLKNTIALLKDGGNATLTPLEVGISGDNIRSTLLRKSDGSYWLALQYDKSATTDTTATTPATINFSKQKTVEYYHPDSVNAYQTDKSTTTITMSLPDKITLLKISDVSTNTNTSTSTNSSNSSSSTKNSNSGSTSKGTSGSSTSQQSTTTPNDTQENDQGFLLESAQLAKNVSSDPVAFALVLTSIIALLTGLFSWLRIRARRRSSEEFSEKY